MAVTDDIIPSHRAVGPFSQLAFQH